MDKGDTLQSPADSPNRDQSIRCTACESALQSSGRESITFMLLNQFTIPLVGCDNHLEEFCCLCGLASEGRAKRLNHRPAGGVHCPSCRHAPHKPQQPIIPVGGGGLAILACTPTSQTYSLGTTQACRYDTISIPHLSVLHELVTETKPADWLERLATDFNLDIFHRILREF